MICEKCRHEIGPEELKCPNCGADNPFALQHVQNMAQFQTEFAKTETEVTTAAGKVSATGKKAVLLFVLIICSIALHLYAKHNYADPDLDAIARQDAEKNAAQYAEEMDGFLARGEYMEFCSYCYAHEITMAQAEEYERFRYVKNVAMDYYECIQYIEKMTLRSRDENYFDSLDTDISNFCMYLERYYQTVEAMKNEEEDDEYLAYIADMETEMTVAMKVYFAMDDAELEEFLAMTKAQKGLRLEEILRHE